MSTLEKRLEKMEKQLRFYRWMFTFLFISAGFLVFTAFNSKQTVPALLKAKEFQVVDDYGRVLVSMKKDYDAGNIRINNTKGGNIINMLKSDAGTGTILTKTENGTFAVRLVGYDDGKGGKVEVYSQQGKVVTTLGSTDRSTGYIGVKNSNDKDMFEVTYGDTYYGGWAGVFDYSGNNVARMNAGEKGGQLRVFNSDSKEMVVLGITSGGDGVVSVYNNLNNRICVLGPDASSNGLLNVLNKYGSNMNGVWPKD